MKSYEIYINLISECVMPLHLLRQFQRAFTGPPCSISIRGSYGDHVRLNVISQPGCLPISPAVKPPKVRHHLKINCWKLRTCSLSLSLSLETSKILKQPAGPETVPIKRTFLKKNVILPQCRADLMIGNPGKTWGAFFGFSASSLQRMHRYQLAISILVNASPLPSSSIHHQEVTFGTQVAGNWLFHQIPHRKL